MHHSGSGGFGKFEIVLRFDLVERSLRIRQRHFVGEFEHFAVGQGRPYLRRGCRFIEAIEQCVDVVLAVGRSWRGRRWRGGGGRRVYRGGRRPLNGGLGGRGGA